MIFRFLFLIFFHLSLFGSNNIAKDVASITANFVYNLDNSQTKVLLKSYFKEHPKLKAVKIIDYTDNSVFIEAYIKDGKLIFSKIPKDYLNYQKYESEIIYDDEVLGKVSAFYDSNTIHLTPEEKAWIKTHVVKIGVEDWRPVVFVNSNGDIDGIAGDFTKKIIELTGLKTKIVGGKWNKILNDFKQSKIDILPATYYTRERATYGLYSQPYLSMKNYLYVREDSNIHSFADLKGKKLAIVKGYGTIPDIRKKFPDIQIIETKNLDDSIAKVLKGEVDALYEGQIAVEYKLKKDLIKGLKPIAQTEFKAPKLYYFVNINDPILLNIIKKALNHITAQEREEILSKWVYYTTAIAFTPEEKKWLKKGIKLKYAFDPDWRPLEWADEVKEQKGIIADILKLIEHKSGLKIEPVYCANWDDVLHKVDTKQADFYATGESNSTKNLVFTKYSILTIPYVFVSRKDENYVYGFKDLKNKKVGVFKNSTIHNILKEARPEIKLILFDSDKKAFDMLKNKQLDVIIFNAITAKYYINHLGYKDDLKIAYKTEYNLKLKFALRKDIGQIPVSILNKSIKSLSEKEISDIVDKWVNVTIKTTTDWKFLLKVFSVFLIIVIFMLWNNKNLNKKVKEKTQEIRSLLKAFDKYVIASRTDDHGRIIYVSEAFCKISGYTKEELLGKPHSIVRHPDMPKEVFKELWDTIKQGKIWRGEVKNRKKDGGYYWVDVIITPELKNGKYEYSAIRQDITDRKKVEELTKNQEKIIAQRTKELLNEKKLISSIVNAQENIVVASNSQKITMINDAFKKFYQVKDIDEFVQKYGPCICDSFDTNVDEEYLTKIVDGMSWIDYIQKHPEKQHKVMIKGHIFIISLDTFEFEGQKFVTVVLNDITELEEVKIKAEKEKKLTNSIINSQDSIVVTSDGKKLTTINKAFKKFYNVSTIEEFIEQYGPCICDSFEKDVPPGYITKEIDGVSWVDYILQRPDEKFKVIIKKDNIPHIFSISLDSFEFEGHKFITVVLNDITELEKAKQNIEVMHKHTKDSIEFASLLQTALIPEDTLFKETFKDYFIIWEPKDIVGGDIYLFEILRNKDESLLMVIDCTGHGVPGAFVTMIVKAVEREIVSKIKEDKEMEVSPSWVLSYFNKTIKKLLRQESKDSMSNAGFDGGIIYYNKKTQILKFSGAQTPLFYVDNDEVKMIKGDRHSIGYKKSDKNYKFKEHILEVNEGMKFYITTDGYLDQNGGEKGFPFGKKRFMKIIEQHHQKSMALQKVIFIDEMKKYEAGYERNDDMTVIGFEIDKKSEYSTILEYDGVLTQAIISHQMDILEHTITNISVFSKLSTIVVEMIQNMMKYSKSKDINCRDIRPAGCIKVFNDGSKYMVVAKNIVAIEDKEKIEKILEEIKEMDIKEIKKMYRALRKSGKNTHAKGGGIGFYEIAKLVKDFEYCFEDINQDKYYFKFKVYL